VQIMHDHIYEVGRIIIDLWLYDSFYNDMYVDEYEKAPLASL